MSDFYFGNYILKRSFIHSLDARLKIIYLALLSILVFSVKRVPDILIFSASAIFIIYLADMDLKFILRNLKKVYFIILLIFVLYLLTSNNKIYEGLIVIWRFLVLILLSLVLTYTTPLSELTLAIEKLAAPLRIFRIKPRNIAIMISISIRFIPVMLLRFERLRDAMLARLSDFKKPKNIKIFIITLLDKVFLSANNISDAMTARLYNENAQSSKIMSFGKNDYISGAVFSAFFIIVILARIWYN